MRCPPGDRPPGRFLERYGSIDRRNQPNGPGRKTWLVEAHHWVSGPGEYDPLFGDGVDKSTRNEKSNAVGDHVARVPWANSWNGSCWRFIGDAMLIVFPTAQGSGVAAACESALDAATDAVDSLATLNHRRRRSGARAIRFGVGLHVGAVVYGNVGAPNRLDFTVMGPAVNRTARLESLTKQVLPDDTERPILMSDEFAANLERPVRSLGRHPMKGVADPPEVFALDEDG